MQSRQLIAMAASRFLRRPLLQRVSRHASTQKNVSTPVLISGGGPAGLVTALCLGRCGVDCVLVEPREAPSAHPRAHVLTARTVEICESLGVGGALDAFNPPFEGWRRFRYCGAVDGRGDYGVADHGSRAAWANLEAAARSRVAHVSQPRFEAVLRDAVAGCASVDARFGASVAAVDVAPGGSTATLGDGSAVRAARVVACDGFAGPARRAVAAAARAAGAPVDRAAGVPHRDEAPALQHFVSVAFSSKDLAARVRDRPAMLYFVFNAETASVVVAHDLEAGSFNLQFPFFPPAERAGDAAAPANVRRELAALFADGQLPGDLAVASARPWLMRARLADRFAAGDFGFLAGDAAHEMPPSGGLGLNTAVGDAHNLGWKLALAGEGGVDAARLLATYEAERRPAAAANVALAVDNWRRGLEVPAALGLPPAALDAFKSALGAAPAAARGPVFRAATKAARAAALAAASEPDPRLAALLDREAELPLFFPRHDLGLRYDGGSAAAAADAAAAAARPGSRAYAPRVAPGERLPDCAAAFRLGPAKFSLLVVDPAAGAAAAAAAAGLGAALDVDGDAADLAAPPGVALVLVRPDRYVAAVFAADAAGLRGELEAATFRR